VARRRTEAGILGLLAVVASVLLLCCGSGQEPRPDPASPPEVSPSPPASGTGNGAVDRPGGDRPDGAFNRVVRVVDGDTFHVHRGGRDVTVRLIGIDTPEVGWYGGRAECHGSTAGRFLRNLLRGERVRLEFDADRIDPYGRTLAYAYLEDGRMLNVVLVRRGHATVTIYEPNDRHEPVLRAAQADARASGAGLWSACR
jgi:micrococcal nuclease